MFKHNKGFFALSIFALAISGSLNCMEKGQGSSLELSREELLMKLIYDEKATPEERRKLVLLLEPEDLRKVYLKDLKEFKEEYKKDMIMVLELEGLNPGEEKTELERRFNVIFGKAKSHKEKKERSKSKQPVQGQMPFQGQQHYQSQQPYQGQTSHLGQQQPYQGQNPFVVQQPFQGQHFQVKPGQVQQPYQGQPSFQGQQHYQEQKPYINPFTGKQEAVYSSVPSNQFLPQQQVYGQQTY